MKYIVFKRSGHRILTILHPETASTFETKIPRLLKKRISRKIIDSDSLGPRKYIGPGYSKRIKRYSKEMLLRGGDKLMNLVREAEPILNYVYTA